MLQTESILEVVDNTGVKKILVIRCLGGSRRRYARIGDLVKVAIKKKKPTCSIDRKEPTLALVVTTKHAFRRKNNTIVRFSRNCAVLVKKDDKGKYKALGTRILIPLLPELDRAEYKEIVSLSSGVI